MTELDEFRAAKNEFFRVSPHSPLTPQQQRQFPGLNYFPESEGLRLQLPIERFPEPTTIRMQTTTGDVQSYERYGQVRFSVDGQEVTLTVYRNDNGYFLPFVDSLAGGETYGAGRYLEPEELPDGRLLIDFNLAYNPYCAYNADWSCPITPAENRLKVPIRAGEKVFHSEES
ncbi:MAG TPA: DUF1684 domain-containing protein [Anaerolineales bacterium]|nr:DUF1684 domain-containing protein [Anaerolineales bacterium]